MAQRTCEPVLMLAPYVKHGKHCSTSAFYHWPEQAAQHDCRSQLQGMFKKFID